MNTNLPNSEQTTNISRVIGDLLGVNASHILTQRLVERRLSPDVIQMFDIRSRGEGWTYPTPRGALRFKNADSDAPNKYAWIGDKRDTLLYGSDLRDAVEQADGVIWLVTEFDFFAMRSAGIHHVVGQMQGEGSVPKELPAFLQVLGARICCIAPDRDNQGTAWAEKVSGTLISVGLAIHAYELPYPKKTSHGADIGKLWQEYGRSQHFDQFLLNLRQIGLATQVRNRDPIL